MATTAHDVEPATEADVQVAPRRGRGRSRTVIAVVLLVVLGALAGGWVAVGRHPGVEAGGFTGHGTGIRVANDGIEDTRYVMESTRPGGARLVASVRNDGRLPFTLLGLGLDPEDREYSPLRSVLFQPDPYGPTKATGSVELPAEPRLTLEPGEEAGVVLHVEIGRCIFMSASRRTIEEIPLRVRHAGITSTQSLPLYLPLTIVGTSSVMNHPTDCPPVG